MPGGPSARRCALPTAPVPRGLSCSPRRAASLRQGPAPPAGAGGALLHTGKVDPCMRPRVSRAVAPALRSGRWVITSLGFSCGRVGGVRRGPCPDWRASAPQPALLPSSCAHRWRVRRRYPRRGPPRGLPSRPPTRKQTRTEVVALLFHLPPEGRAAPSSSQSRGSLECAPASAPAPRLPSPGLGRGVLRPLPCPLSSSRCSDPPRVLRGPPRCQAGRVRLPGRRALQQVVPEPRARPPAGAPGAPAPTPARSRPPPNP